MRAYRLALCWEIQNLPFHRKRKNKHIHTHKHTRKMKLNQFISHNNKSNLFTKMQTEKCKLLARSQFIFGFLSLVTQSAMQTAYDKKRVFVYFIRWNMPYFSTCDRPMFVVNTEHFLVARERAWSSIHSFDVCCFGTLESLMCMLKLTMCCIIHAYQDHCKNVFHFVFIIYINISSVLYVWSVHVFWLACRFAFFLVASHSCRFVLVGRICLAEKQFLILMELTIRLRHTNTLLHPVYISWPNWTEQGTKKIKMHNTKRNSHTHTNPIKSCKMNTIVENAFALVSHCSNKHTHTQKIVVVFLVDAPHSKAEREL